MLKKQVLLGAIILLAACTQTTDTDGRESRSQTPVPRLSFATYWGAGGANNRTVCVDPGGNVYMCGGTSSKDWPTTMGTLHAGDTDVTIAKFDSTGKLLWSRLLGGPTEDYAYVSAVNEKGELYVSGRAGAGFPTTNGAFDETFNGGIGGGPHSPTDAFVIKLSPNGKLIYSTYIGGSGDDGGRAIHLLPSGKLIVGGGNTTSDDLPTDCGSLAGPVLKPKLGGRKDGWVAVVSADGASLDFCTYFGPNDDDNRRGDETIRALGTDRDGNIWIGGTSASGTDMQPTSNAFQKKRGSGSDNFIAKISPDGKNLLYFSWLGGNGFDEIETEGVSDTEGNFYVAGSTGSTDFPTSPAAFQSTFRNAGNDTQRNFDGWVAKISNDGNLEFSTLYGGTAPRPEAFFGPVVDNWGYVYCSGRFSSLDCPVTTDAFQPKRGGDSIFHDAVLAVFSPDGQQLVYGTYFGGSDIDMGRHIGIQPDGKAVYIIGETRSLDIPLMNPLQRTPAGTFIAKFNLSRDTVLLVP